MALSPTSRLPVVAGVLALSLAVASSAFGATSKSHHKSHTTTSHHRHSAVHEASYRRSRHHRGSSHHHAVVVGQQAIEPQRATEIQQALIQAHYLDGAPSGQWDAETQAAMVKYQTDNGWQSKITPDSRALIKLGLGPKQDAGEYATAPTGVSNLALPQASGAAQDPTQDPVRAMATSEMPTPVQN